MDANGKDLWAAGETKPGIWYLNPHQLKAAELSHLAHAIKDSKMQANATLSIVSAHIGPNWSWTVSPKLRALARVLVLEGEVSVVHGHSSHHIQGIEFIDGKPVMYGLGPFVDDYAIDPIYRNDLSFIYQYDLKSDMPIVWAHAIKIEDFHVRRIKDKTDPDFQWLATTMDRLCRALGSEVQVEDTPGEPPCLRITPREQG